MTYLVNEVQTQQQQQTVQTSWIFSVVEPLFGQQTALSLCLLRHRCLRPTMGFMAVALRYVLTALITVSLAATFLYLKSYLFSAISDSGEDFQSLNALQKAAAKKREVKALPVQFEMSYDGAWCWFADPRAVFYHGIRVFL